jgi:hypothetical protein
MVSNWSTLFDALQHSSSPAAFIFGTALTPRITYLWKKISGFFCGINKFSLESKNLSVRYDRTEPKTIAGQQ